MKFRLEDPSLGFALMLHGLFNFFSNLLFVGSKIEWAGLDIRNLFRSRGLAILAKNSSNHMTNISFDDDEDDDDDNDEPIRPGLIL